LDRVSLIVVILGALNYASMGIFGFDAISYIFGGASLTLSRIVFSIIGLAGLWCLSLLFRQREHRMIDET
jgi:uncharacterized membrane protein YuzA (DUF378 family)